VMCFNNFYNLFHEQGSVATLLAIPESSSYFRTDSCLACY